METKTKEYIKFKNLLDSLTNKSAKQINHYFACDFSGDIDELEKDINLMKILEYLNEEFINIDINYRETNEFENKVYEALKVAEKKLNDIYGS